MNAVCTNSKQEHSKKHPKDLSPSNSGRLLSVGALMFQIQVKACSCAAFCLGLD